MQSSIIVLKPIYLLIFPHVNRVFFDHEMRGIFEKNIEKNMRIKSLLKRIEK
jgi:hypothetical protein